MTRKCFYPRKMERLTIVRRDSTYEFVAQLRFESDCGFEHRVLIIVYIEPQQQEQ